MIPQITLSGTPRQMGLTFGETFRQKIHMFAQTRLLRLKQFASDYCKNPIDEKEIIKKITTMLPWHQNYDDELWLEFCGIADGADISHEMLMTAMGYTDIRDYLIKELSIVAHDLGGCSAFVIPSVASKQGVICGQTWDMSPEALDYLVLVHRKPNTGPETLYLTTTGGLGLIGLNDCGIAIGNTNLMSFDNAPGVHYLFTITRALKATSLTAAIDSIINTPRLSGHNFYLADSQNAVNIETTATKSYCTPIKEHPFVYTNHYLSEALQPLEIPKPKHLHENTRYRFERMKTLFVQNKQIWNAKACWQTMSDDTRNTSGAAICNEDFNGQYGDFATVATCILIPQEKTLLVCPKGAKSGAMQTVSL
jgi:hypothetical protein